MFLCTESEDILRKISDWTKQIRNGEAEEQLWKQQQQQPQRQYSPPVHDPQPTYHFQPTVSQTTLNNMNNRPNTYTAAVPQSQSSVQQPRFVLPAHLQHQHHCDSGESDGGSEEDAPLVKGRGRANIRH